jgi:hypothetical protein
VELVNQFWEWTISVIEHWHGWVSGGVLAFGLEIAEKAWDFKISKKAFVVISGIGFLWSIFASWQDEHAKVIGQRAYIQVTLSEPNVIPPAPEWAPNQYEHVNFGEENTGSYVAKDEAHISDLVIGKAARPLTFDDPRAFYSSASAELSAWDEMLHDPSNGRNHGQRSFDPGEKHFMSAYTLHALLPEEVDRILVQKTDIIYLVGLVEWRDGSGVHGKSFCYWLHPPTSHVFTFEQCLGNNDYIEDATQYEKFFK